MASVRIPKSPWRFGKGGSWKCTDSRKWLSQGHRWPKLGITATCQGIFWGSRKSSEKRLSWGVFANRPFSHGLLLAIVRVTAFLLPYGRFQALARWKPFENQAVLLFLTISFSWFWEMYFQTLSPHLLAEIQQNLLLHQMKNKVTPTNCTLLLFNFCSHPSHPMTGIMPGPTQYFPDPCCSAATELEPMLLQSLPQTKMNGNNSAAK